MSMEGSRPLRIAVWLLVITALALGGFVLLREAGHSYARYRLERALDAARSQEPGVVEVEPWLSGCGFLCDGGYSDFVARHRGERTKLSRQEMKSAFAEMDEPLGTSRQHLSGEQLRLGIRQGLAVEELFAGIANRPLLVATLGEVATDGIVERRLLFGDPEVGSFEGLLLLPESAVGDAGRSAIVGLHGHRDDAAAFANENLGRTLAQQGYVVVIPTFRAHDCGLSETLISLEMLEHGFTLLGLKVYETLLMGRYLESLDEVDSSRLGLLAHSGGSSIADLVVRLYDRFSAKVIDLTIDYRDRCGMFGTHCQTVPDLFPLAADIAAETDLEIATLGVPYKFQDSAIVAKVIRFFESSLARAQEHPGESAN